ncbi:Phospholipase ABHD3-like 2 [Homarus americanus]|uniref:Phospholipase ABHD3-like 2 n=1 Tax=Homarus americanus TaxID=6706 RepID=A0A8J5MXC3_HOMAM|nr:Phospholipase ABHD3-like 2 [Homarus americanus]
MDFYSLYSECPSIMLGLSVGAGLIVYYLLEVVRLTCRRSEWRRFLETHLTILQEKYWPTPWCYESHCQTVLASLLRLRLPDITYKREVLQLKDGGQISLDWLAGVEVGAGSPIVLVLPGLTGSSQSEYVKGLMLAVRHLPARCVVLNNRGIGGVRLMTTRTYCAANSDDLEEALQYLSSTHPGVPIVAIGISLGGMITGNYLTTRGERAAKYLTAAVVMSIPWNMVLGLSSMEKPLCNLLLNRYLAHCLCQLADSMSYQLAGDQHKWNLKQVMKSKTIREFDTQFTAMQFGFRDAEDYYLSSCLHDKLDRIKIPLLCLTAADDPFQPLHAIPLEAAKRSSHVAIIVTARGGHIGFMEGVLPTTYYYSDRLISQLLAAIFSNVDQLKQIRKEADNFASAVFNNIDGKLESDDNVDGKIESYDNDDNVDGKIESYDNDDNVDGKIESYDNINGKIESYDNINGKIESYDNIDFYDHVDGKIGCYDHVDGNIESSKKVDGKIESCDNIDGKIESYDNTDGKIESYDNTDGKIESYNNIDGKIESYDNIDGKIESYDNIDGNKANETREYDNAIHDNVDAATQKSSNNSEDTEETTKGEKEEYNTAELKRGVGEVS